MNAGACLIRQRPLAKLLGVHPDTIGRWAKSELAPAVFRRGIYKISVLRTLGVLPEEK